MLRTDAIDDRALAGLYQATYFQTLIVSHEWEAMIEVQRTIEEDLSSGRLAAPRSGQQKHNLNVLKDHLLIAKSQARALNSLLAQLDADLDRRGYPNSERESMKGGTYAW